MCLYISIQVPKGGPGKTATSHALSYALAHRGLNVLTVDGDSQRDLTRAFFGGDIETKHNFVYDDFLEKSGPRPRTLYESIMPLLQPGNQQIAHPVPLKKLDRVDGAHGSLHVICGDRKTNNLGVKIGTAWMLAANDPMKLELPGAPFKMVQRAAASVNADVVLLDLHPDLSPLNCMLLMSSDYFVMPVEADSPSLEAMWNLKERIIDGEGAAPDDRPWSQLYQQWVTETADAVNGRGKFTNMKLDLRGHHVRDVKVKFMGIIMNKFNVQKGGDFRQGVVTDVPGKPIERWMTQECNDAYRIASAFQANGMNLTIGQACFDTSITGQTHRDYLLRVIGRVPHFGNLNAEAQEQFVPVSHIVSAQPRKRAAAGDDAGAPGSPAAGDAGPTHARVLRFAQVYDQIAYNILYLVYRSEDGTCATCSPRTPCLNSTYHSARYRDNPALVKNAPPADRLKEKKPLGGPPGTTNRFVQLDRTFLQNDVMPGGDTADHWPK